MADREREHDARPDHDSDEGGLDTEAMGYGDDGARRNPTLGMSGAGRTQGGGTPAASAPPTGTGMDVTDEAERPHDELPEGAQTPSTRTTDNTGG